MEFIRVTSFVLALALIFTGLLPILASFGIVINIDFIPTILISLVIILGAIVLIIDGFRAITSYGVLFVLSLLIGLSVLILYLVPLLASFGIVLFAIPIFFVNILYVFDLAAGVFLLIGGFVD